MIGSNVNIDVKSNWKIVEPGWKGTECYLFRDKYGVL